MKLSPWALLAMLLSIGLCPVVTVAAIPAGLWALRDIARTGRRGRRLAWAAIVLGLIVTPVTSVGAWWWNTHVRVPLVEGPASIIAAGQRGDMAAFMQQTGAEGRQSEAEAFLRRLTSACGPIRSTRAVEGDPGQPSMGGAWAVRVPYEAMFEHTAAPMTATFVLSDPSRGWVTQFEKFVITLPGGDSLVWPPPPSVETAP